MTKIYKTLHNIFAGWFPIGLRRKQILELSSSELRCKPTRYSTLSIRYSLDGLNISMFTLVSRLNKQSFKNKHIFRAFSTSFVHVSEDKSKLIVQDKLILKDDIKYDKKKSKIPINIWVKNKLYNT